MENWKEYGQALMERLQAENPARESVEGICLTFLHRLMMASKSGNRMGCDHNAQSLRQFWLQSIPWCAQLSKQIEKFLILYDEEHHL